MKHAGVNTLITAVRGKHWLEKAPALLYDEKHPILLPKCHINYLLVKDQHELMKHAGVNTLITAVRGKHWLEKAPALLYDEKHPILLPKCHITYLVVKDQHELMKHAGVNTLITAVRGKHWLEKAPALLYDEKHPILLPKCHITYLLVKDQHELMKHAGVNTLITAVRGKHWLEKAPALLYDEKHPILLPKCHITYLLVKDQHELMKRAGVNTRITSERQVLDSVIKNNSKNDLQSVHQLSKTRQKTMSTNCVSSPRRQDQENSPLFDLWS